MRKKQLVREDSGLYEVEYQEISRRRITAEDELKDGVVNVLRNLGRDSGEGTMFAQPTEVRAAWAVIKYLKSEPEAVYRWYCEQQLSALTKKEIVEDTMSNQETQDDKSKQFEEITKDWASYKGPEEWQEAVLSAHNAHIVAILKGTSDALEVLMRNSDNRAAELECSEDGYVSGLEDAKDAVDKLIAQYGGKDEDTNSEET